ncbi:MAG: ribonuclease PH [Rickettsiales bacterium]|nr:ribonuclease PH [Rickettsiales bacterium]
MRPSNRAPNQMRQVSIEINVNKYAEGSCLIKFGNTHVLCNASVEERVPPFLKGKKQGWVSAEYSMLPRSTHSRMSRDNNGRPNGRALEIQRLIARSLRSTIDMGKLGERQITIDCDVLQADGGTRCASITAGFVALNLAVNKILAQGIIKENPLTGSVAAISCGIYNGEVILDLDYDEDSKCEVDSNFILSQNGEIIEVQATAEKGSMSFLQMTKMYEFAKQAALELLEIQQQALKQVA